MVITAHARLGDDGSQIIPAARRKAAGIEGACDVVIQAADGEIRNRSLDAAVAQAQEIVRRHFPGDERLSDRIIAERRAEAER